MLARPSGAADDPVAPRAGRRVLLAEDHEDSRDLFQTLLELAGHCVTSTGDGERALALLLEGTFEVAILDVGLPCIDGGTVARRAREELGDRAPRLVAVSGFARKVLGDCAPFDAYLLKPFDVETLLEIVSTAGPSPAGTSERT